MAAASTSATRRVGSAADQVLQGETGAALAPRGRALALSTLINVRWLSILVQALATTAGAALAGFGPALMLCALVIGVSAAVNFGLIWAGRRGRMMSNLEATLQLAFDLLEYAALLFLSGGLANPFALMLIAPVALAASSLPGRYAAMLGAQAVAFSLILAFWSLPPVWATAVAAPLSMRLASAAAIGLGIAFTAGYACLAARQAQRMELALHVTQSVLSREQRLSALGGLAAAAAHELGTPLATISVVAKELAREGGDVSPEAVREDARLLLSQTERCREILRRLTEAPEADDAVHARMSLQQLLHEVIEPHAEAPVRVEALVTGAPGAGAPDIRRMPEVLRAMTSLVDNAVDFAASEVLVTARFDQGSISMEVRDDGPGFSPDVLARLGQPYVTSRTPGAGSRSDHPGMGLGFFIAKTLIERTGAHLEYGNGKSGGAVVAARWPRDSVEAPPIA